MIEIKNLKFKYNQDQTSYTLNDVSFHVKHGEWLSIVGHNGSGKSTTARLIGGLLVADSGQIIVDGQELTEETVWDIRDKIGMVFQNPDNQFIGATVRDDIAFGLENICIPREKMDELIERYAKRVRMDQFLDHEPTKLSGGQKQRVAIAGILAMSPSIIILDESTSMLDPRGRKEINELIRELKEDKEMTIISITHDIEEAKNADRILLLNKGEIVGDDQPETLLMNEKLLLDLHLDTPFALKVSRKLKAQGIQINETLNVEELEKQLCQLHAKI